MENWRKSDHTKHMLELEQTKVPNLKLNNNNIIVCREREIRTAWQWRDENIKVG
jgi:glutaredoxin